MEPTKKRTREQMEDTDDSANSPEESAKRRRVSSPEPAEESKANDSSTPSGFASSGFSKFSGGFKSLAPDTQSSETTNSDTNAFGNGASSFSSFSWGKESSGTKFSFSDGKTNNFDWANKDFTFGSGKSWGKSGDGSDDTDAFAPTPTKPREGEIAGVAPDRGDTEDVTQFSAIVKIYRLESVETDGKTSGPGLDAVDTTQTPRKSATTSQSKPQTKFVEKGMGELRVNTFVDPETKRVRARLLCRREKVMTTLLNVPILAQEEDATTQLNEFVKLNDAYIKFSTVECVEGGDSQLSTYLLRPKEKDKLDEILLNIEAAQQRIQEQDEGAEGVADAN